MSHEFWFGCAIPNSLARGMSQDDLIQFKGKFLENFNSAVTENALKWMIMERRKDEENYMVIDTILNWTERNNIPLRGHNLFWGIVKSPNTGSQYVQDWVMELDDYMAHIRNILDQGIPIAGIDGLFSTEAFFGRYKVTVDGISREVDLTGEESKVIVDFGE